MRRCGFWYAVDADRGQFDHRSVAAQLGEEVTGALPADGRLDRLRFGEADPQVGEGDGVPGGPVRVPVLGRRGGVSAQLNLHWRRSGRTLSHRRRPR
jgi:hypothetical protein